MNKSDIVNGAVLAIAQLEEIQPILRAIGRLAGDDREIADLSKHANTLIQIAHNDLCVMQEDIVLEGIATTR